MGDEPKMVIQVDNKELMEYFESWLEDFKRVSEGMLEKINVDRGATLKIPESDFRKLKILTESLDGLSKKKFGFENAPDFTPMVGAMKRLEACLEKVYIPEKIEMQMPDIKFPAIPAPVIDFTPLLQGIQDLSKLMQQGISASITNFDQMPLVFDKASGATAGSTGSGDASEATLQAILSAISDVVTNTAAISIDADSVNLNTDTLETLIASTNTKLDTLIAQTNGVEAPLATLAGAVAGTEMQVDIVAPLPAGTNTIGKLAANSGVVIGSVEIASAQTIAVTGTFWQATQPVSIASVPSHDVTNVGTFAVQPAGSIAHDSPGTSVNPVLAGGYASAAAPTSVNADGDAVRAWYLRNGAQATVLTAAGALIGGDATNGLDVDVTRMAALVAGSAVIGKVGIDQTTPGTTNGVQINAALPAGTNGIGKLTANSGVTIGAVEIASSQTIGLAAGTAAIGKLIPPDIDVTAHTNYARKYYTSAGAVTDGIVWSPAAGKRWHITSIYFQVSADCTVTFEDDKAGGDDPVLKGEFKAGSGFTQTFDEKYPMASGEDAADLLVTTSAGNIYVTIVGYEI